MAVSRRFEDALGEAVTVPHPPQRIISLVPSITEALFDLGLADRVAGVTRFCVHPKNARESTTVVGGTHDIDYGILRDLSPDVVIANKEENPKADVEKLQSLYPTYVTFPRTAKDGVELIRDLGRLCGVDEVAEAVALRGDEALRRARDMRPKTAPRVLYLIWRNPWMTINSDTFVHGMLEACGAVNVTADFGERYPAITEEQIVDLCPDAILLSSEPYNFQQRHAAELLADDRIAGAGITQALFVDGEYCSWYGTRVVAGLDYVSEFVRSIQKNG